MTDQKLEQAVDYYRSGEKQKARIILAKLVTSEPENASAWFGLALCVDEPERREYCLRRVLELDPEHRMAKRILTKRTRLLSGPSDLITCDELDTYLRGDEQRKKRFLITVLLVCSTFITVARIVDEIIRP